MKILAIDTSCDETSIAIVQKEKSQFKILANIVSSQVNIHKNYGGVFPALAKREHQKNLVPVLRLALKKENILKEKKQKKFDEQKLKTILKREKELFEKTKNFLINYQTPKVDLITVTEGPGLEPCLWTGINFAKALSFFWKKLIVPINHLEGHIFANWVTPISSKPKNKKQKAKIVFPAVALIVSGGHTELVLIKNTKKYKLLGETLDDAAGECLDKIAKIIGLGYPGGPEIEKLAKGGDPEKYQLPRPMMYSKNYNFSFSGLKTATLYLTKKLGAGKIKQNKVKINLAASSQKAVIDVLVKKTIKAAKENKVKTIIVGGGVASNNELRKTFYLEMKKNNLRISLLFPQKKLTTDNAAMIAIAGFFNKNKKIKPKEINKIKAKPNLNF